MRESFGRMQKEELEKWNKQLAEEGMPEELESSVPEEEHSPAFDTAVADLYLHYATAATEEYAVHRRALEQLRERLKAGGGTDIEAELLSEDFARDIEDRVTSLQRQANEFARMISQKQPSLATRPEALAKLVVAKLRQESGGVKKTVLEQLADRATEVVHINQ